MASLFAHVRLLARVNGALDRACSFAVADAAITLSLAGKLVRAAVSLLVLVLAELLTCKVVELAGIGLY